MTYYDELNKRIINYLENDKTNTAIMLDGEWGCGKSYYIKNQLLPALEERRRTLVLISLYGLKSIDDVSKSLYMEARLSRINKPSEVGSIIKSASKTILKGVTSFFGINLEVNDEDLKKIYSSIDLSEKLVVLEDFERCPIDKIELLGYINNLVEQDGVKVMIVANEKEILTYKTEKDSCEKKQYDLNSSKYLNVKEKTVGDTFKFHGVSDDCQAIKDIIDLFSCPYFEKFKVNNSNIANEVLDVMREVQSFNLRSLKFACQKTIEMFEDVSDIGSEFFKRVFLGNIAYCLKKKKQDDAVWNSMDLCSYDLGARNYPLYNFAYDYIENHHMLQEEIKDCKNEFEKSLETKKTDKDLEILYTYYIQPQIEVEKGIANIKGRLEESSSIPIEKYPEIANYLISARVCLDCDKEIDRCLDLMITNTKNQFEVDGSFDVFFHNGISLETKEQKDELEKFKLQLNKIINEKEKAFKKLNYDVKNLQEFSQYVDKRRSVFYNKHGFAKYFDVPKFLEMLKKCSAENLDTLRKIFRDIYSISNIREFLLEDKNNLSLILDGIKKLSVNDVLFDKIQKKQLEWFEKQIQKIIETLGE